MIEICEYCKNNPSDLAIEYVIASKTGSITTSLGFGNQLTTVEYIKRASIQLHWCRSCEDNWIKEKKKKRYLPAIIIWALSLLSILVGLISIFFTSLIPSNLFDKDQMDSLYVIPFLIAFSLGLSGFFVLSFLIRDRSNFIDHMIYKLGKYDGYSGCTCFGKSQWENKELINHGTYIR